MELAILAKDQQAAVAAAGDALASVREAFEPETTARNLRLIREVRDRRQDGLPWAMEIEDEFMKKDKLLEEKLQSEW